MQDSSDAIESMEQLAVAWRAMVRDRDAGADVRDLSGIAVRWADCRFAFWNCLTLTDVDADAGLAERRLGEAVDIMRSKKHPGYLWIFEDLLGAGRVPRWRERPGGRGLSTPSPAPAWPETCSRSPSPPIPN